MDAIPVMRPLLPSADDVLPYLRGMDARRVYTNFGPLATELERRYAARFRVPAARVVACSSATLGLQGAMQISPATGFHCPAWTFPATPLAVVNAGKTLMFEDVRLDDWRIEVPPVQAGAGLVPVLPFGATLELDAWLEWPEVVVDAAASGGSAVRDLSGLPEGWAIVISLHATKVLGAGEGGIVVFGDEARAARFRSFTSVGFRGRRESDLVGTNAKLAEPAAAYGLAALDGWEREESDWRAARALVTEAGSSLGIDTPLSHDRGVNPYWIALFPDAMTSDRVERDLAAARIETRRWWPVPCSRMAAFAGLPERGGAPHSEALSMRALGLPFFRGITESDVERVIDGLASALPG